MYKIILTLLLLSCCRAVPAQNNSGQQIPTPNQYKHELGLLFGSGSSNGSPGLIGLQYTKWKNDYKSYRLFLAYGNYRETNSKEFYHFYNDTAWEANRLLHSDLVVIGGALQVQRNLYKRIYMFAALEARLGYGHRQQDIRIMKYYYGKPQGVEDGYLVDYGNFGNIFYAGFVPCIGIKAQYKRIGIAIDVAPIVSAITATSNAGTFEISIGNANTRLFLNYRF